MMKKNVNIKDKDKLWRVLKSLLPKKTLKKLISVSDKKTNRMKSINNNKDLKQLEKNFQEEMMMI